MTPNDEWRLPGSGEACARCAAPLAVGARVTSVIRLPEEGPVREDLCGACGDAVIAGGDLFFWKHVVPESAARRPVVDYAMLRELFPRLLARPDAAYARLAYLVALVLIRKRFLRLVAFEPRGGREVMVVTRGAGQPRLDVPAPYLSAEDLAPVRDQLTALLHAELADEDLAGLAERATADEDAPEATPEG